MCTPNIRRNLIVLRLGLALAFGLALLFGLLSAMSTARAPKVTLAPGATIRYVAPAGGDSGNDCTDSGTPCDTVQHAVDVAGPGDEIRVATGIYTDVQARSGITQVVYISKTVTVRGGYTTTDWSASNPISYPTTLDAQGQGRVLYITGDPSIGSGQAISPTVEGLRITGGDAAGLGGDPSNEHAGGGVYVITATVIISNNQVFSNTAEAGGGLYFLNSANVTLAGNPITNNTGLNRAGGVYFRDSPGATLIANTISNNVANHIGPGKKHHGGVYFLSSANATLINNTISDNWAADTCGGMTFRSGSANAMLIGNNVIGNSAGSPGFPAVGGGLCFVSSNDATLISNMIAENSSIALGGGLYLERSDITMINNVIVGNQITTHASLTGSGSALYSAGSSPRLLHTTLARNSGGDGSGVYVTDIFGSFSTVAMTNTILVSHSVGITVTAGNTATLEATLWGTDAWANLADWGGAGHIITGPINLWDDPVFVDPDAGDYHIGCGSAAIDAGVYAGVDDDIDGDPRPLGHGYDLGADEISCLYLPVIMKSSGG